MNEVSLHIPMSGIIKVRSRKADTCELTHRGQMYDPGSSTKLAFSRLQIFLRPVAIGHSSETKVTFGHSSMEVALH